MKLYDYEGEVFTSTFDAEALYDIVKGANATKAIVILRVNTIGGMRMQMHLSEIDVARSLEQSIRDSFPDEECRAFDTAPPTLEDPIGAWGLDD